MRRFLNKLLPLFLCVIMVFGTVGGLIGCGGGGGEQVDNNKEQLYVAAYGGGYGTKWLDGIKQRFEEYCKDMEFENGKKGVQLFYTTDKDKYTAGKLEPNILYENTYEVFFVSGEDALERYITGNKLLDISDVVTTPLSEFNETRSIEDKMSEAQKAHYKRNGKYYSLPDIESSLGVVYDIDLFVSKELYFAKGGCESEFSPYTQANNPDKKVSGTFTEYSFTGTGEKSAGPDGLYGTYDDGCPATIDEYKVLLNEMTENDVDPLVWSDLNASTYTPFFLQALWADYHGAEEGQMFYTGASSNGVMSKLVTGWNGNSPIVEDVLVTPDNYAESVLLQAGRYYGLELMETMIDNGYVSSYSFDGLGHTETQERFLASKFRDNRAIAMMIEGTWWETEAEAAETFDDLSGIYGDTAKRENRNFGLFPMPKVSEKEIGPSTMVIGATSLFVRANIDADKVDLAKKFIRFVNCDESLRNFTVDSGLPKALDYTLDVAGATTNRDKISGFAKSFWDLSRNSNKIYDYISDSIKNNTRDYQNFKIANEYHSAPTTGGRYETFVEEFKFDRNNYKLTAKDYFLGFSNYK